MRYSLVWIMPMVQDRRLKMYCSSWDKDFIHRSSRYINTLLVLLKKKQYYCECIVYWSPITVTDVTVSSHVTSQVRVQWPFSTHLYFFGSWMLRRCMRRYCFTANDLLQNVHIYDTVSSFSTCCTRWCVAREPAFCKNSHAFIACFNVLVIL